ANNPCRSVSGKTCHVNQIVFAKPSFLHILFVQEDERAKILHSTVSVVVGVNGRIPLIVRPHGAKYELAGRRNGITEWRRRKFSQACGRTEDEFARWLFQPESQLLPHTPIEALETFDRLIHLVANEVIVGSVGVPRNSGISER